MTLVGRVEAHLVAALGPVGARASVSFLGVEPLEVLRFDDVGARTVRYATLGLSRYPMGDPALGQLPVTGPRAELLLSLRHPRDSVFRRLAALAASPLVEGLVLLPGAGLDLGGPLWEGSPFTGVLVGEPAGLVPDLEGEDAGTVSFLPLLPMTAQEAAWKRVRGAAALQQLWLSQGCDLRDPERRGARLPG